MRNDELRITEFCPICGQEAICSYIETTISVKGEPIILTFTFICTNCGTKFELEERQVE